jgi:hypothetical protein
MKKRRDAKIWWWWRRRRGRSQRIGTRNLSEREEGKEKEESKNEYHSITREVESSIRSRTFAMSSTSYEGCLMTRNMFSLPHFYLQDSGQTTGSD